jgi:chromosome segregation ATPase
MSANSGKTTSPVSWILAGLLAAAALATTVLWRSAESKAVEYSGRVADLERQLASARASAANGSQGATPSASTAKPEDEEAANRQAQDPRNRPGAGGTDQQKLQQAQKTIAYLESRLAEARRELTAGKQEASQAEARLQTETANAAKAAADLRDLRDELDTAKRTSAMLEAELRSRTDALAKAETSYKQANERVAKMAADSASTTRQITANSREIDDLSRRRENYMTSLQRRFREVTDLYRGFALDQQNRGTNVTGGVNNSNPPMMQAGDLSRIQNAITQAEDDLRQVQTLNARIATLMKPAGK